MNFSYIIYTTVDITPTGIYNVSSIDTDLDLKQNQQRNFDTICQVISLRANMYNTRVEVHDIESVKTIFPNPNLPDSYRCWTIEFLCDYDGIFGENNEALLNDLHMVPIIPALTETVPQFPPYFISYGDLKNIYIP